MRFRRLDTGAAVEVTYTPARVPPSPQMSPLLVAALRGRATPAARRRFAVLRQARVRAILTGDPGRVVQISGVA